VIASSSRIAYIGSSAHETQVRQAALLAELCVDTDTGLVPNAAVVVAEHPFPGVDPQQFFRSAW
jgi:hypothetical protein